MGFLPSRHGTHGMPGNGWLGNSSTLSQALEKRRQETDEQKPGAKQSATSRLSERDAWSGVESPRLRGGNRDGT